MLTQLDIHCFTHMFCALIIICLMSMAWMKVLLDGPLFDWFYAWGQRVFGITPEMRYKTFLHKSIWYVIFHCTYCNTGQICLWTYLVLKYNDYNPLMHLTFVATGIGLQYFLSGLVSRN